MADLTMPSMTQNILRSEEDILEVYDPPMDMALRKSLRRLERHSRTFIEHSPFVVISSFGPNGADVSPRGDPAGFVRILDDRHLLLPDRPGNNRLDTIRNICAQSQVGLLFLVPGLPETLRVNGRAAVTTDATLLAPCAVAGKMPLSGIIIEIDELFLHCGKALIRSGLWKPEQWPETSAIATPGRMIKDQMSLSQDVDELDDLVEAAKRDTLY